MTKIQEIFLQPILKSIKRHLNEI